MCHSPCLYIQSSVSLKNLLRKLVMLPSGFSGMLYCRILFWLDLLSSIWVHLCLHFFHPDHQILISFLLFSISWTLLSVLPIFLSKLFWQNVLLFSWCLVLEGFELRSEVFNFCRNSIFQFVDQLFYLHSLCHFRYFPLFLHSALTNCFVVTPDQRFIPC